MAIGSHLGRLCSGLSMTDDLEGIIALDIDEICAQFFLMTKNPVDYKKLVCLQDDEAQQMLDLLQTVRINTFAPNTW